MASHARGPGYNAAVDLIGRNLAAGRGAKPAFVDGAGALTYAALDEATSRFAGALGALGVRREQRILVSLHDTTAFPVAFLGALKAGVVPVPVNTLLTASDYAFMMADCRAALVVVSAPLVPTMEEALASLMGDGAPTLLVAGRAAGRHAGFDETLAAAAPVAPVATHADEPCFWLYSSGSTGRPKGTVHAHSSLIETAELYARPILGIREDDVVFSAAKLFFAYGLGNALTFPMAVGATSILLADRPSPAAVFDVLRRFRPTLFYGVPTLFAALLADPGLPRREDLALRLCTSAGEPLPSELGRRWTAHFGVEIIDGIGSTEMLHIFLSNRPGEVRYGTTGRPVPGYELRIVGEDDQPVRPGFIGDLLVSGPTSALCYWNNRERSRNTFVGQWTRTGDKYFVDENGYYVYCGRSDDMLKVGGIYVSPAEVEAALVAHEAVLEAAVIGASDESDLVKPKAFVVLRDGNLPDRAMEEALKAHVKEALAPYKYPRWIEFLPELPKTATGKIQRFKLRDWEAGRG